MTTKKTKTKTTGARKARKTNTARTPETKTTESGAILLTGDNTRDVMREHHEGEAAQWLQRPWDGLTGEAKQAAIRQWREEQSKHEDLLRTCIEKNEPPPHDSVFAALLCVRDYPAHLSGIGLHDPKMRQASIVQRAVAEIEAQFNYAGRVLHQKARTIDAATAVAVDAGLKALRATFAPNPDGYGTAIGIPYPRETWPDDMNTNAAAWGRLPELLRGDLLRFRDALAKVNHASGTDRTSDVAEMADTFKKATRRSKPKHELEWWERARTRYEDEGESWPAVANVCLKVADAESKKHDRERHCDYLSNTMLRHLIEELNAPGASRATIKKNWAEKLRRYVQRKEHK